MVIVNGVKTGGIPLSGAHFVNGQLGPGDSYKIILISGIRS